MIYKYINMIKYQYLTVIMRMSLISRLNIIRYYTKYVYHAVICDFNNFDQMIYGYVNVVDCIMYLTGKYYTDI